MADAAVVESLIRTLRDIEDSEEIKSIDESPDHPLVVSARAHADDVLVDGPVPMRESVRDAGFPVFSLETDRFGWLLGGIRTAKGVLRFG